MSDDSCIAGFHLYHPVSCLHCQFQKHVLVSCTGVIMVHIHVKLGEDRALDGEQRETVRFSFTKLACLVKQSLNDLTHNKVNKVLALT